MDDLTKQQSNCSVLCQALCIISKPSVRKHPIRVKIDDFFVPCDLGIWWWPWKTIGHTFYATSRFVHHDSHMWIQTGFTVRKRPSWVNIDDFFVPCDLEIWRMTLKNNRASFLCYFKLCASVHRHLWIQSGVTVRKRPIWVKIGQFMSRVTFKFDGWPWKKIGHHFYATSNFVFHFIAICEFKL